MSKVLKVIKQIFLIIKPKDQELLRNNYNL